MAGTLPIQQYADGMAYDPVLKGGWVHALSTFHILLANRDEIDDYLTTHADIVPLLETLCAKLRETFGQRTELSLEWYRDPEQADQYLCLYVRQEKYEAGILHRIETVIAPFMSKLEAVSANLLITTDFRPPQG
jgi:hypothetical protein